MKQSSKKAVRRLGADGTQKDENTTIDGHCHFDFQFCAAAIGVQQLEAINEQFDEAFNKHDATAVAAFYTANAILSSPLAGASGLPDIEKYFTNLFQRFSPSDRSTKMNYVYAFGGDLCAIGGWTVTITGHQQAGGYLVNVYTPVRNTWKIRAAVFKYATSP